MKQYALYKGDQILSIGTIYQIAKEMKVDYKTIMFYKTNTYIKRYKKGKNRRILIEA